MPPLHTENINHKLYKPLLHIKLTFIGCGPHYSSSTHIYNLAMMATREGVTWHLMLHGKSPRPL